MADVIVNGQDVYRYDGSADVWRRIPDVDTANAMGVDFGALEPLSDVPQPIGADFQSVDAGQTPGGSGSGSGQIPAGITVGDYGGASDVSSLSQTDAGQQILEQAGITPQDVPQIPPPGQPQDGIGGAGGADDGGDDNADGGLMLVSYEIIGRDLFGNVSLAPQAGGEATAAAHWRSLIDVFAYDLPAYAQSARVTSGRFMSKVS